MNISPAVLGFIRGLGVVVATAVLSYLANAANLDGIVSPMIAAIIASIALGIEQHIESKTGNSLFGAVRRS